MISEEATGLWFTRKLSPDKPMPQPKQQQVVIIGAGYAGLALARAFQQGPDPPLVTVLESREAIISANVSGELELPSGSIVMDALGLSKEWSALEAAGSHAGRVPLQPLLTALAGSLSPGTVKFAHCVTRVSMCSGEFHIELLNPAAGSTADVVVLATGLRRHIDVAPDALGQVWAVGDVRWANDRWWDFGAARLRRGGNTALQDALVLGVTHSRQVLLGTCSGGLAAYRLRGSRITSIWRVLAICMLVLGVIASKQVPRWLD